MLVLRVVAYTNYFCQRTEMELLPHNLGDGADDGCTVKVSREAVVGTEHVDSNTDRRTDDDVNNLVNNQGLEEDEKIPLPFHRVA